MLSSDMVISTTMMLPAAILHDMRLMLTGPRLRSTSLIMLSMTIKYALTMTGGFLLMRLRLPLILLLLLLFLLLLPLVSEELLLEC